jgi:hypothetical protein
VSNEIEPGKRVLFRAMAEDPVLTPGIVEKLLDPEPGERFANRRLSILSAAGAFVRPASEVKLGTQDTDKAAWMLHDGKTSTPVVHRKGCYICEDPEFAQMGLPLCRPCPECLRRQEKCQPCGGTGGMPDKTPCTDCLATGWLGSQGHIAADETVCDECGYEDTPDDYPLPERS